MTRKSFLGYVTLRRITPSPKCHVLFEWPLINNVLGCEKSPIRTIVHDWLTSRDHSKAKANNNLKKMSIKRSFFVVWTHCQNCSLDKEWNVFQSSYGWYLYPSHLQKAFRTSKQNMFFYVNLIKTTTFVSFVK